MSDTAFSFPFYYGRALDNRIDCPRFKSMDWRSFFYLRLRQIEEILNQHSIFFSGRIDFCVESYWVIESSKIKYLQDSRP